ncbi:UvrB/UvrC motif-containing protein [Phenylobacterium sp. J367]|uniref:UvrB/UvrC motif-containing protein n=1 Tax=Phenylobacterium sp. J367 TaxID=2898435 RepID=UPI0021518885|nr:UvrB/UvrC motif-containing protein [Phenylobacterium sp. J367]MCR5878141.1 UvrB/UvrC motif-containing protein [Phenylobacterium sp. J367]
MIEDLKARLAKAVAEEDFETAILLRDAIDRIERGESAITEQKPGRMGLGSSQERYASEGSKPLPKKPDPMTKGHKPGGRRKG